MQTTQIPRSRSKGLRCWFRGHRVVTVLADVSEPGRPLLLRVWRNVRMCTDCGKEFTR